VQFMPTFLLPCAKHAPQALTFSPKDKSLEETSSPNDEVHPFCDQRSLDNSNTEDADLAGGPMTLPQHGIQFATCQLTSFLRRNCQPNRFRGLFLAWLSPIRCLFLLALSDLLGMFFSIRGLQKAGSGLFQVVFSSVVVWAALLSKMLLCKQIGKGEWFGIVVVSLGLICSALGQMGGYYSGDEFRVHEVAVGIALTLLGSFFHSLGYVLGEIAGYFPEPLSTKKICTFVGAANSFVLTIYCVLYTVPNWNMLVTEKVAAVGGSETVIMLGLFLMIVSNLAHAITYFQLLSSSGAVSTGLLQSIRAVAVFGISSLLYCGKQKSQCYTLARGVSTLLVVFGMSCYSMAKAKTPSSKEIILMTKPIEEKQKNSEIELTPNSRTRRSKNTSHTIYNRHTVMSL